MDENENGPTAHPLVRRVIDTARMSQYDYGEALASSLEGTYYRDSDKYVRSRLVDVQSWIKDKGNRPSSLSALIDNLGMEALLQALLLLYVLAGTPVDEAKFNKHVQRAGALFAAGKLVAGA